jgi:hypothetical protein
MDDKVVDRRHQHDVDAGPGRSPSDRMTAARHDVADCTHDEPARSQRTSDINEDFKRIWPKYAASVRYLRDR